MQTGAITAYMDVAQMTLYAFWVFFAGLIIYLRREDKREGYPLLSERSSRIDVQGFPPIPPQKTFLLPHGRTVQVPRFDPPSEIPGATLGVFNGQPLHPVNNPMLDGLGSAAYANRVDEPDEMLDGGPRIVPLRAAPGFFLAVEDFDPRGWIVIGADNVAAGTVADAWVDRSETFVRYLEVALDSGGTVLLPIHFAVFKRRNEQVRVKAILSDQFDAVPRLRNPDQVTLLEEDKIMGYYAGGLLYAEPRRSEPLL